MKQSTKNKILVVSFFLMLVLAYQYSFSKTFELKKELADLKELADKNSSSREHIKTLNKNEIYLDSMISRKRIGNTSLQNDLLKVLNEFSEEFSYIIIAFKEPHVQSSENGTSRITTFHFTLEGEYKDLEKILYKLEKEYSFGSISHINFERKNDYRLNKTSLQCFVMIQNIDKL